MAESEYCDDYYEYMNDDCDGDCDNCNYTKCDEHPYQKYLDRWGDLVRKSNANHGW